MNMLSRLKSLNEPIKVAIIGTGSAGQGLVYQCNLTPGMQCVAACDIVLDRAVEAAKLIQREYRIVDTPNEFEDTIRRRLLAICQDGNLLARSETVDVLVESSNSISMGGQYAVSALEHGIHTIMMNAEADLIFGPYLMELARRNRVVYSSCDGDQPGVIRRIIDDVRLWGFELVMGGNIKGFLDRYANPTTIAPEADRRFLDHQMCASYTDGTKVCVEMALVANAFGMEVEAPGMLGPRAKHILDIPQLFELKRIFADHPCGVVDYVIGPEPKGGVFVVGYSESAYQKKMLGWFPAQLGDGPFYVFRRPYHLIHIEAMRCIAEAYLDGEALLEPAHGFKTNVYCYAKRNLRKGDELDGCGGYASYGLIENCKDNTGFPICLAEHVAVTRDFAKDEKICCEDIAYDASRPEFRMYELAVRQSEKVS